MNGRRFLVPFLCLSVMDLAKLLDYPVQRNTTGRIDGLNTQRNYKILEPCFCSKNIILAWASGSGLSGLAAALSYAALSDVGFTPDTTLLLMLIIPLLQLIAFLMIIEPNTVDLFTSNSESTTSLIDDHHYQSNEAPETTLLDISEKLRYSPKLLKYFLPLMINFFCEYIINQGLVSRFSPSKMYRRKCRVRYQFIESLL